MIDVLWLWLYLAFERMLIRASVETQAFAVPPMRPPEGPVSSAAPVPSPGPLAHQAWVELEQQARVRPHHAIAALGGLFGAQMGGRA